MKQMTWWEHVKDACNHKPTPTETAYNVLEVLMHQANVWAEREPQLEAEHLKMLVSKINSRIEGLYEQE